MIKITYYSDNYCTVLFEVDPFRPARIWETKLGMAVAERTDEYYISISEKKDTIFRKLTSIPCSKTIDELKEMKKDAQEEFSEKIRKLKNKMDEFKFLQELTKKKKRLKDDKAKTD